MKRGKPVILGDYDPGKQSNIGATNVGKETLVQQQFKAEVDVNTIVRRFGLSGEFAPVGVEVGQFVDVTGITDVASAFDRVDEIRRRFEMLPPEVRDRFGNDAALFARKVSEMSEEERGEVVPVVPPGATIEGLLTEVRDALLAQVKPPESGA